jgi:hypothetical protein
MTTDLPRPLPECRLCQTPTRRRVHQRNDGLCTDCRGRYEASRAVQTQLLLSIPEPKAAEPDLSNVVLLRPRDGSR